MLDIGGYWSRDCQGWSRRAFLRAGASLPLAAALKPAEGAETPKARSVMLIWLVGAPSHLDLCDPKPKAPAEYRGPFSAIPTRTSGMQFSELLPRLASRSQKFSVVRTNINYDGGHPPAGSIMWTGGKARAGGGEGGQEDPQAYPPHMGSVVARVRQSGDLPGFLSLAKGPVGDGVGPSLGYGGGKWGKRYDPFMVNCTKQGEVSIPDLKLLEGLTAARLTDRRELLKQLNVARRRVDALRDAQIDATYRQAYRLLTTASTLKAFDMSQESRKTREAYGRTSFGQSALLGRRLVESGVPFVQVNWSQYAEVFYKFSDYGWDTHADNFQLLADWHGPLLDQVMSALLDDLEQRGLLESTLVLCMGEFGRTPRINNIGSRDHWHPCYFSMWAGGGVQPGRVVGQSDARAEHPLTEPITPEMVATTVLHLAGVSSQERARLRVIEGGKLIDDLL